MTPPVAHGEEFEEKFTPFPSKVGEIDELPKLAKRASPVGGIFDESPEGTPWYQRINWLHVVILMVMPTIGFYLALSTPLQLNTLVWSIVYYVLTGLGITAGYHRLFTHRGYKAVLPLRVFWMIMGSGAVQGSIRWWGIKHVIHHRYVDTPKDPYAATKGFWFSHVGWLLGTPTVKFPKIDDSQFTSDPVVMVQHRYYPFFAIFFGYLFPTLVAGLGWGDWMGGYVYAGLIRLFCVHQNTFFINSLAHWIGSQPFGDHSTARDSFITSFFTFGEGNHCYHHTYPCDWKNGYRWYHWDPTKWVIGMLALTGLAYDLKEFPEHEVEKNILQMEGKDLAARAKKYDWGPHPSALPTMAMTQVLEQAEEKGRKLVVLRGFVLDLEDFEAEHPGGEKILKSMYGQDVTDAFSGAVYQHSGAAANLAVTHRIARIVD